MKIKNIEKVHTTYYYIETDNEHWSTYRRDIHGNWEVAMGESWESVYVGAGELERQFREKMISGDVKHV